MAVVRRIKNKAAARPWQSELARVGPPGEIESQLGLGERAGRKDSYGAAFA
jgi:hypothetical protein